MSPNPGIQRSKVKGQRIRIKRYTVARPWLGIWAGPAKEKGGKDFKLHKIKSVFCTLQALSTITSSYIARSAQAQNITAMKIL
jgi:hypothetical protein